MRWFLRLIQQRYRRWQRELAGAREPAPLLPGEAARAEQYRQELEREQRDQEWLTKK